MGRIAPSMCAGHGMPCPYEEKENAAAGAPGSTGTGDEPHARWPKRMGRIAPSMCAGHGMPCPYEEKGMATKVSAGEISAAADEVDDFERVVRLNPGFLPASARENIEIAFDGDAVARHAEVFKHGDNVQAFGDFAALAIDRNGHFQGIPKSLRRSPRAGSWLASAS